MNLKEKLPSLGEIIISETVKDELLEDLEKFEDAKILKENIENQTINLSKIKPKNIFKNENLGKGEKETVEICIENEGIPITDDHQALNFSLSFGLKPKTSEVILLDLFNESVIDFNHFMKSLRELWRIKSLSPEIVSLFKEKAYKIKKQRRKNYDKTNESTVR
ncbi:MAG: hypothetical protein R6U96_16050 [Promethearchaeia archaeon]